MKRWRGRLARLSFPAMSDPEPPTPDWPVRVHAVLSRAGVTLVGYVPDAGLARLIELCEADLAMRALPLTTEEEGIGLAAGGWLGGARTVLLMQSSGVGNLPNGLAMARACRVPLVILVTMRGGEGETNPWQVPMGRATPLLLEAMEVEVHEAASGAEVAPALASALRRAHDTASTAAVLIPQRVIGVKQFVEAGR